MSLANKILVGLIGVASLVFLVMAARTVKTHQVWREAARKFEDRIDHVQKDTANLRDGTPNQPGIRQLRVELDKLLLNRSRAWFKCDANVAVKAEEGTAAITVTTDQPEPHGIAEKAIIYAFEEADVQKDGRYLGEFKVTKSDPGQKQVELEPTRRLGARDLDHLAKVQRPWVLYEVMPRDNHDVMASLSEDEKKAMLPAESQPEFLRDGQSATKDGPQQQVIDGKYVRPLRDYLVLFSADHAEKTLLTDRIAATTYDNKLVDDALAIAKQQEEGVKTNVAAAKGDVEKRSHERDIVAAYRKIVEQELEAAKAAIADLVQANKAMAGHIATLQRESVRRIDERTRAMAQSRAGSQ